MAHHDETTPSTLNERLNDGEVHADQDDARERAQVLHIERIPVRIGAIERQVFVLHDAWRRTCRVATTAEELQKVALDWSQARPLVTDNCRWTADRQAEAHDPPGSTVDPETGR
jgi:hypothetical protein